MRSCLIKGKLPLLFYSTFTLLLILGACRSSKKLTFLRDAENNEVIGRRPNLPLYTIRKSDNLFVSIVSSNPEMNKLYNPAQAGNSGLMTSQMYEGRASQYIYGYEVNQKGYITLPLMGDVYVLNKTLAESEAEIQSRAEEFLKEVTAKVRLLNYKITILGEVRQPGVYLNYNSEITIFDAISMANGITDFAKLENVKVIRPTEEGAKTFILDLNSQSSLLSEAYYLEPNDVVFIQPSNNKNTRLKAPVYSLVLAGMSTVILLFNLFK